MMLTTVHIVAKRDVLAHWWPNVKRFKDITTLEGGDLAGVDAVGSGFPSGGWRLRGGLPPREGRAMTYDLTLRGLPPFAPLSRAAADLAGPMVLPPRRPNATVAGSLRGTDFYVLNGHNLCRRETCSGKIAGRNQHPIAPEFKHRECQVGLSNFWVGVTNNVSYLHVHLQTLNPNSREYRVGV